MGRNDGVVGEVVTYCGAGACAVGVLSRRGDGLGVRFGVGVSRCDCWVCAIVTLVCEIWRVLGRVKTLCFRGYGKKS